MKTPPLLFLDCETLGIGIDAPVWEVAAIRVDEFGSVETRYSSTVYHDPDCVVDWFPDLPKAFQDDYRNRYVPSKASSPGAVIGMIAGMAKGKALVCGSNPSVDMAWLEHMAMRDEHPDSPFGWHYHPEDVPTLARGWLNGKGVYPAPPWKSDIISQMCGVDPTEFDRHTAMGDCEWSLALWQKVMSS